MPLARFLLPVPIVVWTATACVVPPDGAGDGREAASDPAVPIADVGRSAFPGAPPRHYVSMRARTPPLIDGVIEEAAWGSAPWSEDFVDIEGDIRPRPPLRTRTKLMWDDRYLYIAAELEEPDVWGTLTERDAVIFHDDDFEVFIDPDGDTHQYYELEINALGTVWDLFLVRPYRDGGPAIDSWDIVGLRSAVRVDGTINDARDTDRGWTVELALPWSVLEEAAPGGRPPTAGDVWRINFSRVDWDVTAGPTGYSKLTDPATGEPLPEHNWVWSAQGVIDMHRPEHWGYLQFSEVEVGAGVPRFETPADEAVRMALRAVYYAQREHFDATGEFAADDAGLTLPDSVLAVLPDLSIDRSPAGWTAMAAGASGVTWMIREDGRITRRR